MIIAGAMFIAWSVLNHANLRLNSKLFERVLITPRLHRTHHLNDAESRNLGTIFTIWDKLRGTLDRTHFAEECALGNGEADSPQSWLRQFFTPFRRHGSQSNKFEYKG